MKKIAVSLTKGGVGKSITAVNLAAGLSLTGAKVLLIDTDTQGQTAAMLGLKPEKGLADLVISNLTPRDVIVPARDNLWLMAGGRALAGVKRIISRKDFGGENVLKDKLSPLNGKYDYVIMDTSPGWDSLTINVLFYVHEVLAPVSLEVLTLHALVEFNKNLDDIKKYNSHLTFRYILPTFLDGRVRKSAEILEYLRKHCKNQMCSPVRYNVRISEAPGYGQHIFEYSPNSSGAEDYQKLTKKVVKNSK